MNIFHRTFHRKLQLAPNHCVLGSIKNGFITSLDGKIKHLILFDYGLFNKICGKIISTKSDIRNYIDHNLETSTSYNSLPVEKYWLFIMTKYSLSQLLTRIKINSTITYF